LIPINNKLILSKKEGNADPLPHCPLFLFSQNIIIQLNYVNVKFKIRGNVAVYLNLEKLPKNVIINIENLPNFYGYFLRRKK